MVRRPALVYADTLVTALPLVLVVGPAADGTAPFGPGIGTYDLGRGGREGGDGRCRDPRDLAHCVLARIADEEGCRALRHLAVRRRASPLVFADVMPAASPAATGPATSGAREAVDGRLDALFSLEALFSPVPGRSRVTLVLRAGQGRGGAEGERAGAHGDALLAHASARLATHCATARIPMLDLERSPDVGDTCDIGIARSARDARERIRRVVTELSKLPLVGAAVRVA